MKTLIAIIAIALMGFDGLTQGTLEVEVSNLKSTDGYVYLSIYNEEGQFLKEAFRRTMVETIEGKSVILKLEDLPYGTYSVSVMHDENMNGDLDSGTFGIPKEGYGFSNNARGMFGPPSYEDTQFSFESDTKMSIKLIHPPF